MNEEMTTPANGTLATQGTLDGVVHKSDIDLIRERIQAVASLDVTDHSVEFDSIHSDLERALSSIDVN